MRNDANPFINPGQVRGALYGAADRIARRTGALHRARVNGRHAGEDPWAPRGIEIRGAAVALTDQEPPLPSLSREIIRITPIKIVSWGLDGPRASRAV